MKRKLLLIILGLLLIPIGMMAQYWESGTQKTNSFYSYTSGGNTYSKTEVWYDIKAESDGKMEFGSTSLGNVRVEGITLYAVVDGELVWVAGGTQLLVAEDIAAGLYRVKINGRPTDKNGQGGNFVASYILYPEDYVNDPEPNDTWELAYGIKSGNPQHGHLGYKRGGYRDTEDWFMIVVPDEGSVTFTTHSSSKLRLGYLGMYTLNAEGTGVNFRNDKWMDGERKDTTIVYTIPDVAPGTYYVRLRRYEGYGGYTMTYTFTPNPYGADVADNNTWDKAVDMALDTPTDGRMGYHFNGDTDGEDWYKIEVKEEGKLTFLTKTETTLRLGWLGMYTLNAEGTGVSYRNDKWMDGEGKDTTVTYEVPDVSIGTYYIRVRRYSGYGGYKLTCYFTSHAAEADPEPNNTWAEALELKSGPAVSGQLGYVYNGDTDTEDWYVINVPKEGSVVFSTRTETTLRLGWLGMYTLNAEGTNVSYRNDKWMDGERKDTTIVYTVPDVAPGTYYVRLRRYEGYGTYTLQYIHNPNIHENDPEPNDTWDKASLLESGTTQQGCFGYHHNGDTDGEDWFYIVLPDEGTVTFATTSESTLRLGWLGMYTPNADGTGTNFRNDKWMDAQGKDSTVTYTVPDCAPGIYYVRLRRYSGYGGYDLDYNFTPNSHKQDNLDNDTWDKATLLESGTTQQGRFGYHYNGNTDGEDWFYIEVPDEGTVTFATTAESTLRLGYLGMYTLNAEGTDMRFRNDKWMDAEGKDSTVYYTVVDCAPGIYYIRLRRYSGYGGYKLDYTFTPNIYGPDFADNNTWDKATVLEIGSTQQGRMGYHYNGDTDGEDWYVIDVPYVGNITLTLTNESTMHFGYLGLYLPKEDGTDVTFLTDRWMDAGGKDSTIVYNVNGRGAGTYYVRLRRYSGYGGYALRYDFERNPFDRDNLQNGSFATRATLKEGQTISTTMGYSYRSQNNEDWYDLGLMHGRQIDVTICPDTTHTLVIGVPALYVYKGDREDGSPILENVAEKRLERSQGTISYIDKNEVDQHYVFRVPNYNGSSYGGYTITFEGPVEEGVSDMASMNVRVMTEGRNTVRKGVPCENPITITNTSNTKSSKFLVAVAATDDIDIIGFRMRSHYGSKYLPLDSVTVVDGNDCKHTAIFYVPSLDPWESYTFTMISEGKGDIAYTREKMELTNGTTRIVVNSNTHAIVSVMGYVEGADKQIFVDDYIVHRIGDIYDLTGEQRLKLTQLLKSLETEKQETGIAAYGVYSLLKRASDMCEMNLLDATCNIAAVMRLRIEYWMNQIGQPLPDIIDNIDIIDAKAAITDVVASWDPNEMVGPQGVGDKHYIGPTQTVNYRILFENKAEAGDAAYRVRVSDELDENVFDVSTVRFGETSHDGVGYNWEMKREGNKLTWDIKGIELPPNVNAPEGEGFVSFSVDLKPNLANGTQIKNKATIIFDKNFPIETNEFVNTLDLVPPTTTMSSADINATGDAFNVHCLSNDADSGVGGYLFFVSDDGGDYAYYGQSATGSLDYPITPGASGKTYSFYVLATDMVGNVERVIPQVIYGDTSVDGIRIVKDPNPSIKVYTVDGRYVGDTISGLKKGIYVVGGKKLFIK